jgi:hypothetical protein
VTDELERGHAVVVASHRFAINQARRSLDRERRAGDQGEAAGPVVPIAGEKPHARRVAAHEHTEAVVFDLVQPLGAEGQLIGFGREARRDEPGREGTLRHSGDS